MYPFLSCSYINFYTSSLSFLNSRYIFLFLSINLSRSKNIDLVFSSFFFLFYFPFKLFLIFLFLELGGLGLEVISHISHIRWCSHNINHGT